MRVLAVAGIAVLAFVEVPLVFWRDSWWRGATAAVAVAALLLCRLALRARVEQQAPTPAERSEPLQRWRKRTDTLISWSEGSRADWDQHLRPLLAREFGKSTSHGDDAATGRTVFGPTLWVWVDPSTVASAADADAPGPGRAVLGAILDRLDAL